MNYQVSFNLSFPEKETKQIKMVAEITKTKLFEYGNSKTMSFVFDQSTCSYEPKFFDIRYDLDYRSDDEPSFIKGYVESIWTGNNGSWKATDIEIKEI